MDRIMRIHAIKTGDVLVKSAFLGSPATADGLAPYVADLFVDGLFCNSPDKTLLANPKTHKNDTMQKRILIKPENYFPRWVSRFAALLS